MKRNRYYPNHSFYDLIFSQPRSYRGRLCLLRARHFGLYFCHPVFHLELCKKVRVDGIYETRYAANGWSLCYPNHSFYDLIFSQPRSYRGRLCLLRARHFGLYFCHPVFHLELCKKVRVDGIYETRYAANGWWEKEQYKVSTVRGDAAANFTRHHHHSGERGLRLLIKHWIVSLYNEVGVPSIFWK